MPPLGPCSCSDAACAGGFSRAVTQKCCEIDQICEPGWSGGALSSVHDQTWKNVPLDSR